MAGTWLTFGFSKEAPRFAEDPAVSEKEGRGGGMGTVKVGNNSGNLVSCVASCHTTAQLISFYVSVESDKIRK